MVKALFTLQSQFLLRWHKTASNGLTALIKVVASGKGLSNLVSAKTGTTEKLLRGYKTGSNCKTPLIKVITNG